VLRREHFARMKDGAVLANAGHFDVEIDIQGLRDDADEVREMRPRVEQFRLGERRLNLLAAGRVVNLAAAEGHPAAVMDISFALQALAAEDLVRREGELKPGVHPVRGEIDREVAALKLASLGVRIDELSPEQERYLRGWRGVD
jgi:adenosylhomocysteinase